MCPNYIIGLNETRLGMVVPKFLCASLRNTISNREAEKALTLGTLYTTDEALKVSCNKLFHKGGSDSHKIIENWIHVTRFRGSLPRYVLLKFGICDDDNMVFQIGLVDEIAVNKTEAIERCEKFLAQYKSVSFMARSFTKKSLRKRELEELENGREEDFNSFWNNLVEPGVQKQIGDYIQSLKKK